MLGITKFGGRFAAGVSGGWAAGPDPMPAEGWVAGPDPVPTEGWVAGPDPMLSEGWVPGPNPIPTTKDGTEFMSFPLGASCAEQMAEYHDYRKYKTENRKQQTSKVVNREKAACSK